MSPTRTFSVALLLLVLAACAHTALESSASQLKTDSSDFEKSLRFQDYGGAAQLVAPAKRQAFLAARRREGNDLTITDMEVVDVQMSQDTKQAVVMSRMRWVKLPSATEVTAEVHERWDWTGGGWVLVSLAGGPFPELEP